jgi:fumarylacetoacetate (FAA) hydrolase
MAPLEIRHRSVRPISAKHAQASRFLQQSPFDTEPLNPERPLMYQGMSDRFLGPHEDAVFASEAGGIDFEGEFGVIVDAVPMGVSPAEAMKHIRLVVQINDWSLRAYAVPEMRTGFGFVLAKPACSVAPFAVTPDELGESWQDGRVCLDLHIDWNGEPFGHANGREMSVGFHELVAHAATTRDLVSGTIIGSGTVANKAYADVGSSCISERRAIEIISRGEPETGFMKFGDRIRMEAKCANGRSVFGTIEQSVIRL